jgi:hypothetical protein
MSANPDKKEFKAWIDEMPGKYNTLHVKGSVTVPTTGWKASMSEAVPQGINKKILILEVKKVKPTGAAGDIVSHIEVSFDKPNSPPYTNVTIRGDGDEFTIDVKKVH